MKEVIIKLLDYSKLNVKQFSEKLGMKRGQAIYDIMSGKTRRISEKLANQIILLPKPVNTPIVSMHFILTLVLF